MRERQDIKRKAISATAAVKAVPATVLVCVVLTSGALFGMAAQTALDHYGLDLASVRDHLILNQVAQSRSALAWWAWWFVAVAAFFVGPLSVAATRYLIAYWWLLRGVRLLVSVALVLGLAAIGHLPAAPSTFDIRASAAAGTLVVVMSAVLAALGARSIGVARRRRAGMLARDGGPVRDFDPVPAPLPRRGGGSIESGLVLRRIRPTHALVPGLRRRGRLALAGLLAVAVLAAVSALSGAGVALELVAPGAIRQLLVVTTARAGRPVRTVQADETQRRATRIRVMGFVPLPPDDGGHSHIAILATIPEGELTFAKGYVRRQAAQEAAEQRAAQQAADIVLAALQFQIKVPDKLRRRAVTLQRAEQEGDSRRQGARQVAHQVAHQVARQGARQVARQVAINGQARGQHHAVRSSVAVHAPVAAAHGRYAVADSPRSHRRHMADNHHFAHGRHGDHERYWYDQFRFAGF